MDDLVGRTFSHFHVLERLGEGGMGLVYKARDVKLDRIVALKFLHPRSVGDDTAKRRFMQEARAASALDHPHICTVYEVDEVEGGGLFIAMALYEGGNLCERLEDGPLPLEEALAYTEQIALGLAQAHAAGIVHRDLKPANVLLADDGLKIVDFGVAKRGDLGLTQDGAIVGTPAYASPEQLSGDAVDHRADIWALGALLYEMLAGDPPFDALHLAALVHAVLTRKPEPLRSRRREVPEALDRLVGRMLEKSADERPSTMVEVLAEVRALRSSPLPDPAQGGGEPEGERHVVGRDRERELLGKCLASATTGQGLLACVAGEPGIGKTTLVTDFLARASPGPPVTVVQGQCSERLLGTEPYLPFLEAVTELLKAPGAGVTEASLRELAPLWYVQVATLSTADPDDSRALEEARTATQERMKRELVAFLENVCRDRPLVVFIEDLHWADVSTIDLLAHVSTKLTAMRLLIVATYRPADMALVEHPFLEIRPDLIARGLCREITLDFLERGDVERYLALEFPEHDFPPALIDLVHQTSEGSPLFMADLVRDLESLGVIRRAEGRWVLSQPPDTIEIGLPDTVRGMVQHKLSRVEGSEREMLLASAVQGYEFDSAVIVDALAADPEEVEETLDVLERDHRLVRLLEERELPDGAPSIRYRFVHALYQNELYDSLKPTKRTRLARAVADALEEHHPESQHSGVASELAMLLETAREHERSVGYYVLACEHAARRFALREAIALARRGLELVERLPESEETAKHELDLQITLGPAAMALEGFGSPAAHAALARAHRLCRDLEDNERLFRVCSEVAIAKQCTATYDEALELAQEGLTLARASDDAAGLMRAHTYVGSIRFYRGEWSRADKHLQEGFERYVTGSEEPSAGIGHPGVYNLCTRAFGLWILGHPDRAVTMIEEALALAEELAHPFSVGFALGFAGNVHHGRREPEAVRRYAERGIAHAEEQGFPHWLAQGRMQLGWALAHEGSANEGLTLLRDGWAGWQATGIELAMAYWPCWIAEAYAAAGRASDAEDVLTGAVTKLEGFPTEGLGVPELHRLRGVHLARGDEAEALIRRALELAAERDAGSYALRAATSLARHLQRTHREDEGWAVLRETYERFTEGFMTADLEDARVILEASEP